MTHTITPEAAARRDAHRRHGRFGPQHRLEPGVVRTIHGDEDRTRLADAVDDAMGGIWLVEPSVSPFVTRTPGATYEQIRVDVGALSGRIATANTIDAVSQVLPGLPADRAAWHAERIAQATVVNALYNSGLFDQRYILSEIEDRAPLAAGLTLTNRDQYRGDGGYAWDEWAPAEGDAWASELFSRVSAAVDESRRGDTGTPSGLPTSSMVQVGLG